MQIPFAKSHHPEQPKPAFPTPILGGSMPIHPKYFKPETWADHVKHGPGQHQFAKFVTNIVERIWEQLGSADEIRAFARLLGDESEWNLLSVGVAVLKKVGAYDNRGYVSHIFDHNQHVSHELWLCSIAYLILHLARPRDPQHFQSCLLWHLVDGIVRARSDRVVEDFGLSKSNTIPPDIQINLCKENSNVCELLGPSNGGVKADQIERLKQNFMAFEQSEDGRSEYEGHIRPYASCFGY